MTREEVQALEVSHDVDDGAIGFDIWRADRCAVFSFRVIVVLGSLCCTDQQPGAGSPARPLFM